MRKIEAGVCALEKQLLSELENERDFTVRQVRKTHNPNGSFLANCA